MRFRVGVHNAHLDRIRSIGETHPQEREKNNTHRRDYYLFHDRLLFVSPAVADGEREVF